MEDEGEWICHLMSQCQHEVNSPEEKQKCNHMTNKDEQDLGSDCQETDMSQPLHLKVAVKDMFAVISGQVITSLSSLQF